MKVGYKDSEKMEIGNFGCHIMDYGTIWLFIDLKAIFWKMHLYFVTEKIKC